MFYVSRYNRVNRDAYKNTKVFITDTQDNSEICFNLRAVDLLCMFRVQIEGIKPERIRGDITAVINVYTPPSVDNAKSLMLFGFSCLVANGVLNQLAPKSVQENTQVYLDTLCSSIADYAFDAACLKYKCTYVFSDNVTFGEEIFKAFGKSNWGNLAFDIRKLSDVNAERFYNIVGPKVQECTILDDSIRKADNIGHQCYLYGMLPKDTRSYICNRKIWLGEFDELYSLVKLGVSPALGWSSAGASHSKEFRKDCINAFVHMINTYERDGDFFKVLPFYSTPKCFCFRSKTVTAIKLLECYGLAGGDDPMLLKLFNDWLKSTVEVMHNKTNTRNT